LNLKLRKNKKINKMVVDFKLFILK